MGLSYGPFHLTAQTITAAIIAKSPGTYVLGQQGDDNVFYINYAGRSDEDVATRLRQHIGTDKQFWFSYYNTAREAFDKECQLYHDFHPPRNLVHPARPKGAKPHCPALDCDELD